MYPLGEQSAEFPSATPELERNLVFRQQLRGMAVRFLVLAACFLVLDCLGLMWALPTFQSTRFRSVAALLLSVGVPFGLFCGQLTALAAFVGLGEGNHVIRFALGAIVVQVAAVLLGSFIIAQKADPSPGELARLAIMTLLLFCVMQLPFWLLRLCRGWHWGSEPVLNPIPRFGIAHILGWSVLLSLPLTLYRIICSWGAVVRIDPLTWMFLALLMSTFGAIMISVAARCRVGMAAFVLLPISAITGVFLGVLNGGQQLVTASLVITCLTAGTLLIVVVRGLARSGVHLSTWNLLKARQIIRVGVS